MFCLHIPLRFRRLLRCPAEALPTLTRLPGQLRPTEPPAVGMQPVGHDMSPASGALDPNETSVRAWLHDRQYGAASVTRSDEEARR